MNIVLIGFMGSGKTEIAEKIAGSLGRPWRDSDSLIEQEQQMPITEIFRLYQETGFRKIERDLVRRLVREDDTVIAAGGGTVLDPENVKDLRTNGKIVYLKQIGRASCRERV